MRFVFCAMCMTFQREKIDLIPHGVPDLPFMDPNYFKDMFGTEGKVRAAYIRLAVAE